MSETLIFAFGLAITVMVLSAIVMLIGFSEAADPAHSRPEDLTTWEREPAKNTRDDLG